MNWWLVAALAVAWIALSILVGWLIGSIVGLRDRDRNL